MSADGRNAQEVGAVEAATAHTDHTDRVEERPEQSEAFRAFVRGPEQDDPGARPGWSLLAYASLVPGFVGFLWPLGLLLGVAALLRIRRTKQTGRWAAVAGLVLCSIWGIIGTSVFGTGMSDDQHARTVSGHDLKVGDCFGLPSSGVHLAREVTAVPCAQLHHGVVFALADLGDAVNGGAADQADGAGKACAGLAADHLRRGGAVPASAGIEYLLPLGNTVTLRTRRTVVCAFVEPTTGWTGGLPEGSSTSNR
ncbi:DUF4190 domain-containing protein [Kitasatospora sp. NPDC004289]